LFVPTDDKKKRTPNEVVNFNMTAFRLIIRREVKLGISNKYTCDGNIKIVLRDMVWRVWIGFIWLRIWPGDDPSCSTTGGGFLDSAVWS
jgi:hypothetical protein